MGSEGLTFDDARWVLERLDPVAPLLLIGGQALNFWCDYFADARPELRLQGPLASKDIDFQGARWLVEKCAELLGAKADLPRSMDDSTPASGKLICHDGTGRECEIDFLSQVYGLDGKEALDAGIVVEIPELNTTVKVLHPVHCMLSRVHNVVGLPGQYDTSHGIKQLCASLICCQEGIKTEAKSDPKAARRWIKAVFQFSLKNSRAKRIYKTHGIDPFDGVPDHGLEDLPSQFHETGYPAMRRQLAAKRAQSSGS